MKELSLNILDIAQNSVKAGATRIEILLERRGALLTITIADDGKGMTPEFAAAAMDPFTTTRTTRKVGMGLPLFKMAAEQTGGTMTIESRQGGTDHGTAGRGAPAAERQAQRMQPSRGEQEARRIGGGPGLGVHLRAMGMAVEEAEQRRQGQGGGLGHGSGPPDITQLPDLART